jgi:hypothetical protein
LLAALALGISHQPNDCAYTVPVLAASPPPVMSGVMHTTDGGCIVWLNVRYTSALRRKDVCQLGAHEGGHLAALTHSTNPLDVMYSPFRPVRRSYCSTP